MRPAEPGRYARGAVRALTRQCLRDARARTLSFASVFALYSYVQPVGYRRTYQTASDRLAFAHSFGGNLALRLFYGQPHDLATVNGYAAWRVGGTLAIAAAAFGLLAAVRALRAEEEAGRLELVLGAAVSRRAAFLCVLAALSAGSALLCLGEFAGLRAGGLSLHGSAYLALATASVIPPCVGVGALSSQLAPTRRGALGAGSAVVGAWFVLRVVADTTSGAGWVRWTTPLGWAEELRPLAASRPLVLGLPLLLTVLLLGVAERLARARDIGAGLLPARDTADARLGLLGSPTTQALRAERGSLLIWTGSLTVLALVLGVVSKSVTSASIPAHVQSELARLGDASIATPTGYLAVVFMVFILIISLLACAQVATARREESEQQLDTLLALPLSRYRWLGGRLLLSGAIVTLLSAVAGLGTWLGATIAGVSLSLPRMLEAGLNGLPVALLFLGVATALYAVVPRASSALSYALVAVMFLWQLVAALLGAPRWVIDVSPFQHVALVPIQPFQTESAIVMLAATAATTAAALLVFRRRDLTEA